MKSNKKNIVIGWLYPELMSTYGDRGNIIVLNRRCLWRGIQVIIQPIDFTTPENTIINCDMVIGGGAQDRQQSLAISDLRHAKRQVLFEFLESDKVGLFVCGSPQLLGHWYTTSDGTSLEGLGFFDMTTTHPGEGTKRLIGNIVATVSDSINLGLEKTRTIVGFENHGGRTKLGKKVVPFAHVLVGNGNNGEDQTEGAIYKNWIATYFHGPFLSKNPHVADWLIKKALEVKYGEPVELKSLDDSLMWQAHTALINRLMPKK